MDDDVRRVAAVLAAAGIRPPEDELAALAHVEVGLRRQVERLYAVEVGDAPLAAQLRAAELSGPAGRTVEG